MSSSNGHWRPIAAGLGTALLVLLGVYLTLVRDVASGDDVKAVAAKSEKYAERIAENDAELAGVRQKLVDVDRRLEALEGQVEQIPARVVEAIRNSRQP